MGKKYIDHSWDFRNADTKTYTHCYHSYPAMMIPKVAGRLLDTYGKNSKYLFDPYCGTGTSLVEANLRGINAFGIDINPLARLIAESKTTILPLQTLDLYLKDFNDYIFTSKFGIKKGNIKIPNFPNIDFWFKKDAQEKLAVIKAYIENLSDDNVKKFFKVAFSETVRDVSLTKKGEFKLVRILQDRINEFNPDVLGIMESKLSRNRKGLKKYMEDKRNNAACVIFNSNTVTDIPADLGDIDIVVTSPPYGDSKTTVAYGQFSRLANQWLGIESANQIDKISMGGQTAKEFFRFGVKPLDAAVEKIRCNDEKRALEVVSFYSDYLKSIQNVTKVVKKGGIVTYVVGNRKVKGIELPTGEATKIFFKQSGFKHLETMIRSIPNKRMPSRNSPTNERGITDVTMHNEYIIVMEKN